MLIFSLCLVRLPRFPGDASVSFSSGDSSTLVYGSSTVSSPEASRFYVFFLFFFGFGFSFALIIGLGYSLQANNFLINNY